LSFCDLYWWDRIKTERSKEKEKEEEIRGGKRAATTNEELHAQPTTFKQNPKKKNIKGKRGNNKKQRK